MKEDTEKDTFDTTTAQTTDNPALAVTDATEANPTKAGLKAIDPAALIIGPEAVARMTGQSRKQVYRWHYAGQMPRPVTLPGRGVGKRSRLHWLRREIEAWIDAGFPNRQRWQEMRAGADAMGEK